MGKHVQQTAAVSGDIFQQLMERHLVHACRQRLHSFAERRVRPAKAAGHQLHGRLVQQFTRSTLVDDAEIRRHPGFQREALEQRLAEGVQRVDAQGIGRIGQLREQRAGAAQ